MIYTDKSVNDKSVNDKSVNDKSVNGKSVNGKSVKGKSVKINLVNDKSVKDKSVKINLVNDKSVKDKSVKINLLNNKSKEADAEEDAEEEEEEERCSALLDVPCEFLENHFSKIPIYDYNKIKQIHFRKLNIFVFQISSYENEPAYAPLSEKINKAYCLKHGYKYEHIRINYKTNTISPYWLRVYQIQKILLENPHIDAVVYLDLDACFREFDLRIEQVLNFVDKDNKFLWYWGWELKIWLNAGFGVCLNNQISLKLIATWIKYYDDVDIKYWYKNPITHSWVSLSYNKNNVARPATEGYEQYRLNQMFTEPQLQPYICPLPQEYLCNPDFSIKSYTIHVYGPNKNIIGIFNSIINKYKI